MYLRPRSTMSFPVLRSKSSLLSQPTAFHEFCYTLLSAMNIIVDEVRHTQPICGTTASPLSRAYDVLSRRRDNTTGAKWIIIGSRERCRQYSERQGHFAPHVYNVPLRWSYDEGNMSIDCRQRSVKKLLTRMSSISYDQLRCFSTECKKTKCFRKHWRLGFG